MLDRETAILLAEQALAGVQREYPNELEYWRMLKPGETPRMIHPVFFGCFDWHSAVHNHWTLARLVRLFPDLPQQAEIRAIFQENFTPSKLQVEEAYLKEHPDFERMYGWAWLLKLAEELYSWDDPEGKTWLENLQPLVLIIVKLYKEFLPTLNEPNREGMHDNTAFGLAFALEYARIWSEVELENLIVKCALTYFQTDKDYPAQNEPDKWDFLSPALVEADLLARILQPAEFTVWFDHFLPGVPQEEPKTLFYPVEVADHNDPLIGHLDGLHLSRAWCMENIASQLPEPHPARPVLLDAAKRNAEAGLAQVLGSNFDSGGHWLTSYAVYYLTHNYVQRNG